MAETKVSVIPEIAELQAALLDDEAAAGDHATGRVRVSVRDDRLEQAARALLPDDDVEVTRVRLDQPVEQTPHIRTEGDVTIVPVIEEVMVVEKRLMLTEEVHIRRRNTRAAGGASSGDAEPDRQ